MKKLFSNLDWFLALGLIGYPLWHWWQTHWRHQPWGHFGINWTTTDFGLLFMLIVGVLYIFLQKISA